ncbi:MAG: diguanylate cyclase [Desulfobulbaceae bacterium]|nr:diguanylate cyclase [Desulfobulbaceae bacterium]
MIPSIGFFKRQSVRSKLLYGYSLTFVLTIAVFSLVLFFVARQSLEKNIERELNNSTLSILNMVQIAANTSIRNHLRGVAEKNLDNVQYFFKQYSKGALSEEEAKERAKEILLSQTIGKTGYIYCINSLGIVKAHPNEKLKDTDLSKYTFIQEQKRTKQGYVEYEWANPGETVTRDKALYMAYFEPWDWIISVSSYRDEFKNLFSVEDFQKSILSITFGKTGYPYVIDTKGNLIIHPKQQGTNIFDSADSSGRKFIQELCENKSGKIIYPWKNPDDIKPREKLVIFHYIKYLNWIVASSCYLDEFYGPLKTVNFAILITAFVTLCLFFLITWLISSSISKPLDELTARLVSGAEGDLTGRMDDQWGGELGHLASNFNEFMENTQNAKAQLLESEEKYRSIFEHAVGGIFQIDLEGKFLNANPSMARVLGYASSEALTTGVENVFKQLFVYPEHRSKLLSILTEFDMVERFETRMYKKDKRSIWVTMNARAIKNEQGAIKSFDGFLMDVTERKTAEEILKQSREELEGHVTSRTSELSSKLHELEQRNLEISILHEMGEMIQVCRDSEETYPIMSSYLNKFFPLDSGAIFLFDNKLPHKKPIASWGRQEEEAIMFEQSDCWAIRHGKPYMVENTDDKIACPHVTKRQGVGHLCIPMITQGEIIGLFYLSFQRIIGERKRGQNSLEHKRNLAITISKQLTLAIANLTLRESLHLKSVQDPLTGLFNRRHMQEYLERESNRAQRHEEVLGVIMLDVDHFKKVNDTHGHETGDLALKKLASYLQKTVRIEDMVCRYGGEEFTVVIVGTSLESITTKMNRICSDVREQLTFNLAGETLKITISAGAAAFPTHSSDIQEVLKLADAALYQAKKDGRDRAVIAPLLGN